MNFSLHNQFEQDPQQIKIEWIPELKHYTDGKRINIESLYKLRSQSEGYSLIFIEKWLECKIL